MSKVNENVLLKECTDAEIEAFLKVSKVIVKNPESIKTLTMVNGFKPRIQMMLRMFRTLMLGDPNTVKNVIAR